MRSQVVTLMAAEDEAAFLRFVLEKPTTRLIPGVRHPTREIPHTRDPAALDDSVCMLWDTAILAKPKSEYTKAANDYCLRSDESLIQFLRSPREGKGKSIGAGRIALATNDQGAPDTDPRTARAMTAWFNALSRWIKANFRNTLVYASDYKPEVGSREQMVWAGPRAIELSRSGTRLLHNGPREYSLHYFAAADEKRVLARTRAPRNLVAVGRVARVGDVVDRMLNKRVFRVEIADGVPSRAFEGPFMCTRPEPKLGDEVACVFNENIFGRHAAPWEPREIKKLTPVNRKRVLASLAKTWKV